jgi:hypothetical protein
VSNDLRDAWRQHGGPPNRGGPSYGSPRVTGASSGTRFPFSTVFGLLILGAIGWAVWKYHAAIFAKFHMATDAENAAEVFIHDIPVQAESEVHLREAAINAMNNALTVHAAKKTRWYVAYGPIGSEEKPRVVRDDSFDPDGHAFFDGVLTDAGGGVPQTGLKSAPKPSTLSASWRTVKVPSDSHMWRVVVGWSEKPTE